MECTKGVFWHQHFLICILMLSSICRWTVTKCRTKVLELPILIHNAKLVGNRRKLQLETLVTDLEYADDMVLLADSWNDLYRGHARHFVHPLLCFGLLISCSKTKNMAVLPASHCAPPITFLLFFNHPPVEPVSSFLYVGSVIQEDCGSDLEVSSRISSLWQSQSYPLVPKENPHSGKASHFQFCHHPHTALWHRKCCVVVAAYPSVAKLHHALFVYHPGYLCLGYEV